MKPTSERVPSTNTHTNTYNHTHKHVAKGDKSPTGVCKHSTTFQVQQLVSAVPGLKSKTTLQPCWLLWDLPSRPQRARASAGDVGLPDESGVDPRVKGLSGEAGSTSGACPVIFLDRPEEETKTAPGFGPFDCWLALGSWARLLLFLGAAGMLGRIQQQANSGHWVSGLPPGHDCPSGQRGD